MSPADHDSDSFDERSARLAGDLDGSLQEGTLEALQGVWSTLEHAAPDGPSHARAVRARLFWESLQPGGAAASPADLVGDLAPAWLDEAA